MKRKKAMAFNAPGGTKNYIGVGGRNLIDNGCYLNPISLNMGCNVLGGTDYSYTAFGGFPSRVFRQKFAIFDDVFISKYDLWDDMFMIGKLEIGRCSRYVFWFLGWRIVVEYFDTNALVDFTNQIDSDFGLLEVMNRFVKMFSNDFAVSIMTENIINVTDYEKDF